MAVEDYEDLNNTDELEDRGDNFEVDDEDQDELEDSEELDDDEVDEEGDEEEIEEEELPKNIKVPKSRLDEVIKQREEAKERSAWLEAQLEKLIARETQVQQAPKEVRPAYNYDEAEEQYIQLVIEGETAKAAKLRAEINSNRDLDLKALIAEVTKETTSKVKSESSQVIEEERFSTLIDSFENKYKFLNADSKEYNEEAVDTVNTLLAGYVAAGKTKSEALKLAVNKVAPLYVKTVDTKQTLGNKRKVEAGKKAVEAAKSQPSKTKSVSTKQDFDKIDVSKMSEKDFAKLTDKEKRILRGD